MEVIAYAYDCIMKIVSIPITLFGFTFTLWNLFIFVIFAGVVIYWIKNMFE